MVINAPENVVDNKYIKATFFDGKSYSKNWISHSDLMNGAIVDFEMVSKPNKSNGLNPKDFPYSFINLQK